MALRISTSQVTDSSVAGISAAYARLATAQQQINSGKQLTKPSDNPVGFAQSLDFTDQIAQLDQYDKTLDQAKGFISTGESALSSVDSLLRAARTYAVQGANDDATDATSRQAIAAQIQDTINQLGNIGNATYGTQSVFAGQRTSGPALQGDGTTFKYVGGTDATGDADLKVDIGPGETITTNVTGDKVFAPALAALAKLRDDVSSGKSQDVSQQDIAALDTQISAVVAHRADFGAKLNRIDATQQRNALTKVNFTKFVSDIQDTDIPTAAVALQTAQTAYQAALQSTVRSFQTSLLDFLK
ncbi:MAG TPA: flagellar hook-associated protein FlgL [Chthonomonadaceae bacterium]|nr:flagellar hook-associated protein FlgL [Chthonomonadaceae bacterium]